MIGFILALLYWFIKLIVYLIDNKKMGMAADRFYCNYNTLHRRKTIKLLHR